MNNLIGLEKVRMSDVDEEFIVDEHTLIDGDILTSTFEDQADTYDRFQWVIVCDFEGQSPLWVPYIYARNISGLRSRFTLVPIETHPNDTGAAVNGEILEARVANPQAVLSLIKRQEKTVPNLYRELKELEQLEMLDQDNARSLRDRLVSFLKTIKVGSYNGEGIFWLPENYRGNTEELDQLDQQDGEDYEDYTRRIICTHIKGRKLPMARIIPISSEKMNMMSELISSLSNYNDDIVSMVARTHYVPLFRTRKSIPSQALKTFMAEEFRCVKNDEPIDGNSMFIFSDEQLDGYKETIPTAVAHDLLRHYVGDYLDELDLSRSFITGSAITASLIKTSHHYDLRINEAKELEIELFYPPVTTILDPQDVRKLRLDNINLWNIQAISETQGIMIKGQERIPFTIGPGADIDLAVDNTVTDDEYRVIANRHFETIRRYYPYVKMREYTKPKGDWNYVIYTDDPHLIPVFRTVEIYRSSFRNICSHHVGAVRGCYTSRWSESPHFYLTASGLWTSQGHETPNYHYFAGRKSNPQNIIVKYMLRGINVSDEQLSSLIQDYMTNRHIRLDEYPFYRGKNVPYSIFSAFREYNFVQEDIRREQEEERERQERQERQRRQREERERKRQAEREEERRKYAERVAYMNNMGIPQINPATFAGITPTRR